MNNFLLEKIINDELNINDFKDHCPNGLQVEGCSDVNKIITGVSACKNLLEVSVKKKADAIIVHHGYFWKNEHLVIKGIKKNRLKILLNNNINLYAYHLPLDAHKKMGNNTQLAYVLGIKIKGQINQFVQFGILRNPLTPSELTVILESRLGRKILHCGNDVKKEIYKIAWCSGSGHSFILEAAEFGVDAFITGEISEQSFHIAKEMMIHMYIAGHHATERYGLKELTKWLINNYGLDVNFVDIYNIA
ncbi:Nif3-like dinuclear metal center hexameric protein [Candidatus Providencia siddallii]|uniref:GTP cyclohydrolase 1 type 2 homolog n=1 Tax=Candidatus Providencia siddallii TaxID=1715285 RepID=A0ABM9NNE4_9GAMM